MRISVSAAKGRLADLVRRARAGEEVVLTRHGRPVARLVPMRGPADRAARRAVLEAARAAGAARATAGPTAARSQDFLYGADGTPQ